jgi:hypothetical protein
MTDPESPLLHSPPCQKMRARRPRNVTERPPSAQQTSLPSALCVIPSEVREVEGFRIRDQLRIHSGQTLARQTARNARE